MASNYLAKGLKRSALTVALGLCFVGGVQAQSNTAGAVSGRATAGDTISIENANTGFSRTITVSGDGSYRLSQLPIGQYTVTRKGADGSTSSRTANVSVGTASNVDFVSASGEAQTLDTVTVVGSGSINPIDVSSVESTTILTAEQIAKIPVPRDATSVALLAPGTVRGDAAFGKLASFGGSSVAENQYYVNGFNITNTFKGLNFAQIPYEAIAEQQVKTGGYGAEFGRSTGGVINMITKSGSNEFHAGGNIFWSPESLKETTPNRYLNNGRLVSDNSKDNGWEATAAIWASGALVKDKLFGYALLQYGRTDTDAYPGSTDGISGGRNTLEEEKSPTWLVKLDWNITDDHLLALTAFSDTRKTETSYYNTGFGTDAAPSAADPRRLDYAGSLKTEEGGESYALKYTGYLTDTFTLSALAGHGEFKRRNYAILPNGSRMEYNGNLNDPVGGCPIVRDLRPDAVQQATGSIIGCDFAGSLIRADAGDERDQYRIDAEWLLGDHQIRFGYDVDDFTTVDGSVYSGGAYYQYRQLDGQDFVRRYDIRQGATVEVNQEAFYLEDSWNVTDNFLVYAGVRWDSFENKNGLGQSYVKVDNQFAPRLGFSWDVNGDSSFKVFGNAGRYALPLTANVAIRGASASLYVHQDFFYDGIATDGSSTPQNLTPCTLGACDSDPFYHNGEAGNAKDPRAIASTNLDPMYQDEYILGFQMQLTDHLSAGIRGIYRNLERAIDDTCDTAPIADWAAANGYDPDNLAYGNPAFPYCRLYNPGSDGVWNLDLDGNGTLETVTIAADLLGPKAKRSYSALEFFWEGSWDRWFMQGSYTYARSKGNSEGGVKSDNGQGDTGTTQDFDYPALMLGSYGYLPNDRRHSLKLFGNYEISDEWSVGANLLVQSGRPLNCFGVYGDDPTGYGAAYFSCDRGEPDADLGVSNGTTIVHRGSAGRTPWSSTLDLNVAYRPAFADGNLTFKVDVFNVLDSDKPTSVDELGEDDIGSPVNAAPTYLTPLTWQTPRSVRFMVQYDF